VRVGNDNLKVDDADKGLPEGQRKESSCVKSQTYQNAATKYK